jgi:hypothetical protein
VLDRRRKSPEFMARSSLKSRCIGSAALLAALVLAMPAGAQFGSIFRDEPPRPPANVPGGQLPPPDDDLPPPEDSVPNRNAPRPPGAIRSDQPPSQPLPAPMSLPPSSRPGGGTIQSQPLAPPLGSAPGQPSQQAVPPQQRPGAAAPIQTLPGLPPGQRQPRPTSPQQADTAPHPEDEVVVEPPPQRITNPTAVFSGLDKITGRIIQFDVAINETVQFGALQVTPRVCYSRPPTETPNTDAFVEVDEVTLESKIRRIFTGWMFAASPGLHAVEHPIYDVWLTDCKGGEQPAVAEAPAAKPAKQPARVAPRRPAARTDQRGSGPALR